MTVRRATALIAAVAATAGLSACGGGEKKPTFSESEGGYVYVGDLTYQVQISRVLNPKDVEDRAYLSGLPAADQAIKSDEIWFAVFVRVHNDKKNHAHRSAGTFAITDTLGTKFEPIDVANTFAYKARLLPPNQQIPEKNSTNFASPTQGELVLFKMPQATLDNRPLEFHIEDSAVKPAEAEIELDV
jgi:hypothetical protein